MIKTLEKRNFPVGKLTLLASTRSGGQEAQVSQHGDHGQELKKDSFAA